MRERKLKAQKSGRVKRVQATGRVLELWSDRADPLSLTIRPYGVISALGWNLGFAAVR